MLAGAIPGLSGAFDNVKVTAEQFAVDNMQITLTNEFTTESYQGYNGVFASKEVAVFVLKEDFSLLENFEDYTLQQYGELVIDNNGLTGSVELNEVEGICYFDYEYNNTEENTTYYYMSTLFKSDDAFWIIQFAVPAEDAENYLPQLIEWAKTVTFVK